MREGVEGGGGRGGRKGQKYIDMKRDKIKCTLYRGSI